MATKLTSEELVQANNLTTREKIAMILLVMMFKVLKPTAWSHEIDKPLEQIIGMIGGEKK